MAKAPAIRPPQKMMTLGRMGGNGKREMVSGNVPLSGSVEAFEGDPPFETSGCTRSEPLPAIVVVVVSVLCPQSHSGWSRVIVTRVRGFQPGQFEMCRRPLADASRVISPGHGDHDVGKDIQNTTFCNNFSIEFHRRVS